MAKSIKKEELVDIGPCRECANHYDEHELTAIEPREPFMCRCRYERWSQFLDKLCINGHFKRQK